MMMMVKKRMMMQLADQRSTISSGSGPFATWLHSWAGERCLLSQVTRTCARPHATLSRETRESSDGDDLSDL